jgi:uncharacterized protein YciI
MLVLAFCRDSRAARIDRPRLLDPHLEYLRTVMSSIRLAAPLATADGAAISDDDRLMGSMFAIEAPSPAAAREIIGLDPYTKGGVWSSVVLFNVVECYGEWTEGTRYPGSPRLYAAFFTVSAASEARSDDSFVAHREYMLGLRTPSFLGGKLAAVGSIGAEIDQTHWNLFDVFGAESLEQARSLAAGDACVVRGSLTAQVMAIPLAVGSWSNTGSR